MQRRVLRFVMMVLGATVAASANASDWGNIAVISDTLGNHAGRLCMGEGLRVSDIGCPSYAPSLTTAGDISVTGNLSANKFIGDGSGLTGVGGMGDRIVSGTTNVIATQDRSVTITTSGAQRVVIGENGNVGIGTASPARQVHAWASTGNTAEAQFESNASTVLRVQAASTRAVIGTDTNHALRFKTNATERMSIDGSGNVGIATTTPAATLQVSGSFIVSTSAQTTSPSLYVGTNGNVGIGTTNPGNHLSLSATTPALGFYNLTASHAITSVAQDLEFNGTGGSSGYTFKVAGVNKFSVNPFFARGGSNGTTYMRVDSSVGVASPAYAFVNDADTGIYTPGANIIGLVTSATERIRVDNVGNVGIGTTTPSATMHVSGTALISSNTEVSGSLKVAGTGSEACTTGTLGTIRFNPVTGAPQICVQR